MVEAQKPTGVFAFCQPVEGVYVRTARDFSSFQVGKDKELEKVLFLDDVEETCDLEVSGIQAACSVKNVRKARRLASLFVSESGELQLAKVQLAKSLLASNPYSLSVGAEDDRKRDARLLKALRFISESIEAQRLIKKISRPLSNRLAERAIRDTLLLPESVQVNDAHARQAVVAAFLMTLRQSLGSCFATAPAIIVHEEQPLVFLKDLEELIGTAKLRRTVGGNEYSVPMSSTWGQGDLKKPLLLSAPLQLSSTPIWRSPSLSKTLTALGLISSDLSKAEKYHKVFTLLDAHFVNPGNTFTNIDEIMRVLLLSHLGLSEAAYQEYVNRPKAMRSTSLVVTTTEMTKGRAEQEKLFTKFFSLWEEGRRIFKAEADCALLKSWEFTIASFAEVKFAFSKWNFYSSLGVNWDDVGGIGQVLYEMAKQRVEETNLELQQNQEKLDAISIEIDYLSRRLQQASTESEMQWVKIEFQTRQAEQYHLRQLCDIATEKTNKITAIHQFLIDQYDHLMQEYFQEIYDADMHDVAAGPFDDSPAGFRLIYKYGRTNPSLWTKIQSLDEYIEALVSFFTITEQELLHHPEVKGIEAEFTSIITRLATHVRSDEFLESAFTRTAIAHGVSPIKHPLENLNLVEKKPWVYTSGGSMNSLVAAYFGLEAQVDEVGRWVENETELLAFLIDTTRQSFALSKVRAESILMHSPTHAFSLLPMSSLFSESLSGDSYSYSWISHRCKDPGRSFYSSCVLDHQAVFEFCSLLTKYLPKNIHDRFFDEVKRLQGFIRPNELAKEIERLFELDHLLRFHGANLQNISLDSLFFESVPYTSFDSLKETVADVLTTVLPTESRQKDLNDLLRPMLSSIRSSVRSKDLLYLCKTMAIILTGRTRWETDILEAIISTMRAKRLLPPMPVIFADSNWVKDFFAFMISPISQEIELWSVNAYGTEGQPIHSWKMWLNGSRRDRTWGVLTNPTQYRAFQADVYQSRLKNRI